MASGLFIVICLHYTFNVDFSPCEYLFILPILYIFSISYTFLTEKVLLLPR